MTIRSKTGGIVAAGLMVLGAVFLSPAPAQASSIVGGISVQGYCQQHYGSGSNAVLRFNTIYGWGCTGASTDRPFYAEQACIEQYRNYRVHAGYNDYHNPYTWFCYRY